MTSQKASLSETGNQRFQPQGLRGTKNVLTGWEIRSIICHVAVLRSVKYLSAVSPPGGGKEGLMDVEHTSFTDEDLKRLNVVYGNPKPNPTRSKGEKLRVEPYPNEICIQVSVEKVIPHRFAEGC